MYLLSIAETPQNRWLKVTIVYFLTILQSGRGSPGQFFCWFLSEVICSLSCHQVARLGLEGFKKPNGKGPLGSSFGTSTTSLVPHSTGKASHKTGADSEDGENELPCGHICQSIPQARRDIHKVLNRADVRNQAHRPFAWSEPCLIFFNFKHRNQSISCKTQDFPASLGNSGPPTPGPHFHMAAEYLLSGVFLQETR